MNTIEKNKLIAEFMINNMRLITPDINYEPDESWDKDIRILSNPTFYDDDLESFEYHTSWDWLMPVIKKIGDKDFSSVDIHYGTGATDSFSWCIIEWDDGFNKFKTSENINLDEHSTIKATYNSVIEFIQWYNKY